MSTVEKALSLLENLSATQPEIGLSEFKALTGLDKGTVYRYLTSLNAGTEPEDKGISSGAE